LDAPRHLGGAVSQQGAVVAGKGHRSQHRQIGVHGFNCFNGFNNLIKIGESFENDQINIGVIERGRLFLEGGESLLGLDATEGGQAYPQRTHVAGDQHFLKRGQDDAPCQLYAGAIDLSDLISQSILSQLKSVGAECVGLDHLRASLDVIAVHVGHQRGLLEIQHLEAGFT